MPRPVPTTQAAAIRSERSPHTTPLTLFDAASRAKPLRIAWTVPEHRENRSSK